MTGTRDKLKVIILFDYLRVGRSKQAGRALIMNTKNPQGKPIQELC